MNRQTLILKTLQRVILSRIAKKIHLKVKDLPESVIKALKGLGYNKSDISIETVTEISPFSAGGQGQQSYFVVVDLESGKKVIEERGSWGGENMFNPTNRVDKDAADYKIPDNAVVIKGSTGNYNFANIYVNPNTLIKALPEPKGIKLEEEDLKVLKIFDGITSAYRKEYLRKIPKSEEITKKLVQEGYLKQNKALATQITTEGKNAVSDFKWNPSSL